ncbi:sigma factor-like helix-turn-helix DNA-binding protein [Nitrobacter sp. 62-23]
MLQSTISAASGFAPNTLSAPSPSSASRYRPRRTTSSPRAIICDVIRALPERSRHIFLLNRIHGRNYREIACALGISTGAVEKHMMRALKAIRAGAEDF